MKVPSIFMDNVSGSHKGVLRRCHLCDTRGGKPLQCPEGVKREPHWEDKKKKKSRDRKWADVTIGVWRLIHGARNGKCYQYKKGLKVKEGPHSMDGDKKSSERKWTDVTIGVLCDVSVMSEVKGGTRADSTWLCCPPPRESRWNCWGTSRYLFWSLLDCRDAPQGAKSAGATIVLVKNCSISAAMLGELVR